MSLDRKRTECGAADAVATETRSVSRCRSAEMAAVDGQVLRQISQIELERLLAMRLFPAKKENVSLSEMYYFYIDAIPDGKVNNRRIVFHDEGKSKKKVKKRDCKFVRGKGVTKMA